MSDELIATLVSMVVAAIIGWVREWAKRRRVEWREAAVIRRTLLKRQRRRGVREQIAHPATLSSWETLRSSPQTEERLRVWARVLGLDEEEAVEIWRGRYSPTKAAS